MNLDKMMKGPSNNMFGLILFAGVVILSVILVNYNQSKGSTPERMTVAPYSPDASGIAQTIDSASSLSDSNFMEVSGMMSAPAPPSQSSMNPADLLPKDVNNEWSNLNPASGDLRNLNLLSADQMIGINTVSSSLRNANYQVRSEPPIPKAGAEIGPWWHSTIEPDKYRRPLEIGTTG